jgi:toxin-antitoxin system PIN domain toxin
MASDLPLMTLLDANILIYALLESAAEHARARVWLRDLIRTGASVGVSWLGIIAFVRIATNRRLHDAPLSLAQAFAAIRTVLSPANVEIVHPGPNHLRFFHEACLAAGAAGNLVTDAHLAALAMEHDCILASSDTDFGRFPGLRWVNPLATAA